MAIQRVQTTICSAPDLRSYPLIKRIAENQAMKKLITPENEAEANAIKSILEEHGIYAEIKSFHDTAYDGLFQSQYGWGIIRVSETDFEEAQGIIQEWKDASPAELPWENESDQDISDQRSDGFLRRTKMSSIKFLRVYSDENGCSHLERKAVKLEAKNYAPPAPLLNTSRLEPADHYVFLELPAGWYGDWHPTPVKQWLILMTGICEFEAGDGERAVCKAGDVVLLDDTIGKGHQTKVLGDEAVRIAAIHFS
jgi:hypothetical protein